MKVKNNFKLLFVCLIVFGLLLLNCSIALAANEGLKVGTYTSNDGHTITVNGDGTALYDDTYSLTVTANDKGDKLTGKLGTNKKSATFYQLNSSKIISGAVLNYTHDGATVYLYDYTVFGMDVTPVVDADGGIEVWSNGSKVDTYADLQSAVDAAKSGDTIKIIKDLDVVGGTYVSGKNLTIDGDNHTLNSAIWLNSVFVVEEDATLNINNLTIDGGATGFEVDRDATTDTSTTIPLKSGSDTNDPKQNLSAIITKGNLIAAKLNMNNNYTSGNGAAIQVVSGNITVTNSNFNHNRANKGGAFYIGSNFKNNQTTYPVQNVVIENTTISNNFSNNGGGMFIYNTNKIIMEKCDFLNNSVTGGKGGGIFFHYQSASDRANYGTMGQQLGLDNMQTEIDNCVFEENWVGNDGFAIENQGAEMLITNTEFNKNIGLVPSTSIGTVSNMAPDYDYYDVTFKNCIFEKNEGGCAGIGDHATTLNLIVEDTKFIENKSWSTMLLYTADAVFKNCEFIGEKTTQAVIVVSSMAHPVDNPEYHKPTLIVEDCTFTDTVNGTADIQIRKYSRIIENNTATLYLEGNTNGNIHIWDDNRVVVNGNHTGNIYKDSFTSADEWITISDNAIVDGKIDDGNDKYTYTLSFWDMEDGYEYRRYLYLDKDRTYTKQEFFMEHFISEDGYELKLYTDNTYTTEWDYTASVSTNKVRIYGKWVEHTHTYDGSTILYENAIYEQCECGYLGKSLTLSEPSDLVENDKEKPIVVNDEIGIDSKDYSIVYQVMNKDGVWEHYDGVPVKEGTYKAILTYNNMSIEHEYTIAEKIEEPKEPEEPEDSEVEKGEEEPGDSEKPKDDTVTPEDAKDETGKKEDSDDQKNEEKTEESESAKDEVQEPAESIIDKLKNPNTSDNILVSVVATIISLIAIAIIISGYKKR